MRDKREQGEANGSSKRGVVVAIFLAAVVAVALLLGLFDGLTGRANRTSDTSPSATTAR